MSAPLPPARRRLVAGLLGAPLIAALLLAGCSADETATSADSAGGLASSPQAAGSGGTESKGGGADTSGAGGPAGERTVARVVPGDRDIIYRGSITVRVRDVARAAARAESLVAGVDGVVFSEQTSLDPGRRGYGEARMTLRVPPSQFGPTLDALGRLGRELTRSRSAEDVTGQLADVDSRVRSQERSVARVRLLLGRADTIGEVVQVESELARREADLEALQAQLARLEDVTDLATIEVTLLAHRDPAAPPAGEDDLGFLPGLRGGWEAFAGMVLVASTVLGALVPFAVAGAVLGLPAYVVWRRRRPAPATADSGG